MRVVGIVWLLAALLAGVAPASAKPPSVGSEQLAKDIEAGLKGRGTEVVLDQHLARRLVTILAGRDSHHASVAAFGLGLATDEESLQALHKAAKEPMTAMVGAFARTALLWRKSRGESAEARKRLLVKSALATTDVLERMTLVALLGRFYPRNSENELLQLMDGDSDARKVVAIYCALLLERSSEDKAVIERVAKRVEAIGFGEIGEGLCGLLCYVRSGGKDWNCLECADTALLKRNLAQKLDALK